MENINNQSEFISLDSITIEKRNDGDAYLIGVTNKQQAEQIIKIIFDYFNEPTFYLKNAVQTILEEKNEYRFESTFSLKLFKDNQLLLDNRNGRGVKANRARLEEISHLLKNN